MITWIVEHTLLLLPTWFWFAVAGTGAILYFFSSFIQAIPFAQPKLAGLSVKYIGFALLLGGIYLSGGAGVTELWKSEVKDMQDKIAAAESKSAQVNTVIKTQVVEKIKLVKDTQVIIQDRIVEKEKIIDAECKVAPEAISILNDAAKPVRKGTVTVGDIAK
jgi:hypothetical protein